jgi:hypothetical protein
VKIARAMQAMKTKIAQIKRRAVQSKKGAVPAKKRRWQKNKS